MMTETNSRRPIIAVDMDEVIADALGEHLVRYNRDFGRELERPLTRADVDGHNLWEVVPEHRHPALIDYMESLDFFRVLAVMPDAQRVLEALQSRYEVYIATAAMEVPMSFRAKFEWLGEHFPFIRPSHIVFCGDKSILRADYLIDDNPRQLRLFEGGRDGHSDGVRREGILYTSSSNQQVEGFRRVNGWLDVEKMFLG
jgi:5'(3')-deoxyribonucleotidase